MLVYIKWAAMFVLISYYDGMRDVFKAELQSKAGIIT